MPSRFAESATPCAWLPALAAITPRFRSSPVKRAIRLYAPRILKLKVGWRSSRLSSTSFPRRAESRGAASSGVSRATSYTRLVRMSRMRLSITVLLLRPARRRQIRLRFGLALERRHFVGIDAHHQVVDVIVDLREPVAGARRNHDDVAGFEIVGGAVADRAAVAARSVEETHRLERRRALLRADD